MRATAKASGLTRYFTGRPCKHGHVAERFVSNGWCVECAAGANKSGADYKRRYYTENRESLRAGQKEYRERNREVINARKRGYVKANRTKETARHREWCARHPERVSEYRRNYYAKNPHKINAKTRLRQASQLQRTPAWLTELDLLTIEEMYRLARERTEATGVRHHVDHVVPLCGKAVSGLHVPQNLRVIPASENSRKSNKFEP